MKKHIEWIEDLLGAVKASNDPHARALINHCGEGCAQRKHAISHMTAMRQEALHCKTPTDYAAFLRERMPVHVEACDDGIVMHLGKKLCSCPLSADLSQHADILCECTRGHETAVWSAFFGKPVNIEIIESILRGGQDCVIKIQL